MTNELSPEEKGALFHMLSSEVFRKASSMALSEIRRLKSGADTLEGSALAHQFNEGAISVLDMIYGLAEIKKSSVVLPKRLLHNA